MPEADPLEGLSIGEIAGVVHSLSMQLPDPNPGKFLEIAVEIQVCLRRISGLLCGAPYRGSFAALQERLSGYCMSLPVPDGAAPEYRNGEEFATIILLYERYREMIDVYLPEGYRIGQMLLGPSDEGIDLTRDSDDSGFDFPELKSGLSTTTGSSIFD